MINSTNEIFTNYCDDEIKCYREKEKGINGKQTVLIQG